MLGLVAAAVVVISVASTFLMRDYLIDRIDTHLAERANSFILLDERGRAPTQQAVCLADYDPASVEIALIYQNEACGVRPFLPIGYDDASAPELPKDRAAAREVAGELRTVHSTDGNLRWRVVTLPLRGGQVVTLAEDLSMVEHAIGRLVIIQLLVGAAVLITMATAGGWAVRRSLRSLGVIERTAAAIASGDLRQRVPDLGSKTEVGRLAGALNVMLAQIEQAFTARAESEARAVRSEERMREFVADASHELRTPLTTIRGFAELYRQGATDDPAAVLRRIEDEAARMGLLVEDLLLLARLDRERPLQMKPVPLTGLVTDAAAAARAVAPDRTIEVELPAADPVVVGDEPRLRQVIGNLVTNALTHTPAGTPVTLRLRGEAGATGADGTAVIEVSDAGHGLTAEQAERVFERFYRVDKARTRQAASAAAGPKGSPHSGTGLGLAIVAALVAAHDGAIELDTAPGVGATFRVRLPLAPVGTACDSQLTSSLIPAPPQSGRASFYP
ncbi:HAMP domain-containing sensor histidine kinase [Luedemannella flava]